MNPQLLARKEKLHIRDKIKSTMDFINNLDQFEGKSEFLNTLQKSMVGSIENDIKFEKQQQALQEAKEEYKQKDNIRSLEKIYADKLDAATSKKNVEDYADFQYVNKLLNKTHLSDVDTDVEAPDSSQIMAVDNEEFSIPIDPLTKIPIENPCKSVNCGHVYEYESILNYIRHRMKMNLSKVCPVVGCVNNNLTLKSIIVDDELKEKIEAS